ncbi:MAG: reductase [Chitinophagaceae bacterium]|nr:MAG: reductase [Chitinophagaceae bacterium]
MRKLVLQEWITLDGFAADENGAMDFFTAPELNKESDKDLLQEMDAFDTIILGANTYKLFADYWPAATTETEPIADKLNETPKIVFSSTLTEAPWGKWNNVQLVNQHAEGFIRQLKQEPGKNMVVWGSLSLAQSLLEANLVDVIETRVCPTVLGNGRPLFPSKMNLRLEETKRYNSGLVLLRYSAL